jgi:hypothetical protein
LGLRPIRPARSSSNLAQHLLEHERPAASRGRLESSCEQAGRQLREQRLDAACRKRDAGVAWNHERAVHVESPVWREFDWQATIPDLASIVFGAQSGVDVASLLPATPLTIATAKTSTDTGVAKQNFDVALMDTGPGGTSPFRTADPGVASRALLRITIKLNPTPNQLGAPSLQQWKVQYDCVDSE